MRALLVLALLATPAFADEPPVPSEETQADEPTTTDDTTADDEEEEEEDTTPPVMPPPPPLPIERKMPACPGTSFYAEPFVFGGLATRLDGTLLIKRPLFLHRIAGGALLHSCSAGEDGLNGRFGMTLVLASQRVGGGGIGVEGELNWPRANRHRVGGRLGVEIGGGTHFYTVGGRYRVNPWSFGLDVAYSSINEAEGTTTALSFVAGVGVEGKPGRYAVFIESALTVIVFAISAISN